MMRKTLELPNPLHRMFELNVPSLQGAGRPHMTLRSHTALSLSKVLRMIQLVRDEPGLQARSNSDPQSKETWLQFLFFFFKYWYCHDIVFWFYCHWAKIQLHSLFFPPD